MATADGRYWIVYNGEVYNYVELRRELQRLGRRFVSESDTEVVLQAFAEWGRGALGRLVGMFVFAILDTVAETVLLARDQFGIKPLYVANAAGSFVFASEITPLVELMSPQPTINSIRAFEFLQSGRSDESSETMVGGIHNLQPGHTLAVGLKSGAVGTQEPYWELQLGERSELSFAEAAAITREKFLTSIDIHLRSDVPVGACLSGGIDSSACVAAMRYVKGSALDLQTFTYSAGGRALDETKWAGIVSSASNTRAHYVAASAANLTSDLDALIRVQGEPFATTSIYAQHLVFRAIGDSGIKVVLDGQGADEMLGGYALFLAARIASALRGDRLAEAWKLSRSAIRRGGMRHAPLMAGQFLLPQSIHAPLRRLVGKESAPVWLNPEEYELNSRIEPKAILRSGLFKSELIRSLVGSLRALLRYEDRNSMAFSVESRLPFLTTDLVQFLLTLPEEYLISSDGTTKAVFREAMRGIVPDSILDRKDKISFQTPESDWMSQAGEWAHPILQSELARACPILDSTQAVHLWNRTLEDSRHYRPWLWRWLNLIRWAQINSIGW